MSIRFGIVALSFLALGADSAWATDDIIGFLLARHLVVDGVVDSSWKDSRQFPSSSQLNVTVYRIRVSRALFGTAPDSTIEITSQGPDPQVQTGFRVIGYGDRIPEDGFRLWGGFIVVAWGSWPVVHEMFDSLRTRSIESGFTALHRANGIAIVRLKASSHDATDRVSYTCDSLGWVFPTSANVPRTLDFAFLPDCTAYPILGDTLIVPVERGSATSSLTFETCQLPWMIKNGFLLGFGVPLTEVDRAIEHDHETLRVRPFLRPR